jgi:cell shape-determining protein MreC
MEQDNVSKGSGYKTLSIVLMVILILFAAGAFVYWKDVDNTQKEQQAQIDALNQQLTNDKQTLTSELESARDEATRALEQKNAELQQKLDEATSAVSEKDPSTDSTQ